MRVTGAMVSPEFSSSTSNCLASSASRTEPKLAGSVTTLNPPFGRAITSSAPPSSATSNNSSSVQLLTSRAPCRVNWNMTLPDSAILPPAFFTTSLTSELVRLLLSVKLSITTPTPPCPYASYVSSEKLPTLVSLARFRLRSMRSLGTLASFAFLSTSASCWLLSALLLPPAFAAAMICFPILPNTLARAASALPFRPAIFAARRPIKMGGIVWKRCTCLPREQFDCGIFNVAADPNDVRLQRALAFATLRIDGARFRTKNAMSVEAPVIGSLRRDPCAAG
mmetsp:Transcript_33839/g.63736  ORF Transcript_33839/g.63736 Transcript_33839/m.63736 type:complete len:281 (-) Transcript_33839:2-844(-)